MFNWCQISLVSPPLLSVPSRLPLQALTMHVLPTPSARMPAPLVTRNPNGLLRKEALVNPLEVSTATATESWSSLALLTRLFARREPEASMLRTHSRPMSLSAVLITLVLSQRLFL